MTERVGKTFITSEAAGGLALMGVTVLALAVANSPLAPAYFAALNARALGLSVLHWVNDGLMAVFFLLVGLEIKRELLAGELATWSGRALPGIAAVGGMLMPALIYVALNWSTPETLAGWAIPSATDIAFALGVLALLGPRVPASLKVFLTALAILDDLGAVAIIAVFYTAQISGANLLGAALVLAVLGLLGRSRVDRLAPYLVLGAVLWVFVLRSGVHATLAGVALAMTIPLRNAAGRSGSPPAAPALEAAAPPLERLEHALAPWVAFLVVPVFGFANAGVSFAGLSAAALLAPVPLGIAAGLFVGKQLGIFLFAWGAIRAGLAELPANATWPQLYGVALLCGIGFTMSLFIGLLAFADAPELQGGVKIGVLAGSLLSALAGAAVLLVTRSRVTSQERLSRER